MGIRTTVGATTLAFCGTPIANVQVPLDISERDYDEDAFIGVDEAIEIDTDWPMSDYDR